MQRLKGSPGDRLLPAVTSEEAGAAVDRTASPPDPGRVSCVWSLPARIPGLESTSGGTNQSQPSQTTALKRQRCDLQPAGACFLPKWHGTCWAFLCLLASAAQVQKEFGQSIRELLGEADSITGGSMQSLDNFVEKTYFPGKVQALRPSTLYGYKHFYKRFVKDAIGDQRMCDIKLPVAQQMLDTIAKEKPHLSSGLFRHLKWLGVAIFDYAAQQGAFSPESKNPFSDVSIPRTQHVPKPVRYATLDDVVAMINAVDESCATVIATAAFSGLRKSEIQALRWEDLKDNELYVRRSAWRPTHVIEETKTQASRAPVPVIPILAKYLEAHRNGNSNDGFIFAGAKLGRPLDLHNLAKRVICPALKEAKVPWCGFHGFRRGLATTLYELGTEAKTRQAILRHANVSITENVYTMPVSEVSKAAMAKVEKAFNTKLKAAEHEKKSRKAAAGRKKGQKSR